MPKINYVPKRFTKGHSNTIERANAILDEYAAQGFVLTLRQLYYQFVARGFIPNRQKSYKRLGGIIGDARLAGRIDWDYLEDRSRNLSTLQHFDGPQDALDKLASWYHVDMWANQEWRPEVWIEKDALSGVIAGVCKENDVPYFSCRGYTSLSEMWRASLRLKRNMESGQKPFIIHFGDHDPSGIDMSRDITDRLRRTFMADCTFERVALNMDQVREYDPPPNPAKVTDSRYKAYLALYGDESWELDALEPTKFRKLVEGQLEGLRDQVQWDKDAKEKAKVTKQLKEIAGEWSEIPANKRKVADLQKIVEAANRTGWNGVDNSKLLWQYVEDLGGERSRLEVELAKSEKVAADARRELKALKHSKNGRK